MTCPVIAVVKAQSPSIAITPGEPHVAVVQRGPRGPSGAPGGAGFSRTAGAALGGYRVVRALEDGRVGYASSAEVSHAPLVLGITLHAASENDVVEVRGGGEMSDAGWSWTPGPIFCGLDGVLTQTPPAEGFIKQVAVAETATRIIVRLTPPIVF